MAQMQMWQRRGGSSWGMGRPGRLPRRGSGGPGVVGREGGVWLGGGGDGVKVLVLR